MQYILLKLNELDRFRYKISNSVEMTILSRLLTSDILDIKGWREWAIDPKQKEIGGNLSDLYKKNGYIYIGDLYSEQEDGGPFLKVSQKNFIEILDQWEEFCKTKPKEILITQEDNGTITMKPTF